VERFRFPPGCAADRRAQDRAVVNAPARDQVDRAPVSAVLAWDPVPVRGAPAWDLEAASTAEE
jgi:hypothetical protein